MLIRHYDGLPNKVESKQLHVLRERLTTLLGRLMKPSLLAALFLHWISQDVAFKTSIFGPLISFHLENISFKLLLRKPSD